MNTTNSSLQHITDRTLFYNKAPLYKDCKILDVAADPGLRRSIEQTFTVKVNFSPERVSHFTIASTPGSATPPTPSTSSSRRRKAVTPSRRETSTSASASSTSRPRLTRRCWATASATATPASGTWCPPCPAPTALLSSSATRTAGRMRTKGFYAVKLFMNFIQKCQ